MASLCPLGLRGGFQQGGTAELLRKKAGAHRGVGEGTSPAGPEHTSAWEAPRGQAHRDAPAAGRTKILRNTDGVREACLPPSTWPPGPVRGTPRGDAWLPASPSCFPPRGIEVRLPRGLRTETPKDRTVSQEDRARSCRCGGEGDKGGTVHGQLPGKTLPGWAAVTGGEAGGKEGHRGRTRPSPLREVLEQGDSGPRTPAGRQGSGTPDAEGICSFPACPAPALRGPACRVRDRPTRLWAQSRSSRPLPRPPVVPTPAHPPPSPAPSWGHTALLRPLPSGACSHGPLAWDNGLLTGPGTACHPREASPGQPTQCRVCTPAGCLRPSVLREGPCTTPRASRPSSTLGPPGPGTLGQAPAGSIFTLEAFAGRLFISFPS